MYSFYFKVKNIYTHTIYTYNTYLYLFPFEHCSLDRYGLCHFRELPLINDRSGVYKFTHLLFFFKFSNSEFHTFAFGEIGIFNLNGVRCPLEKVAFVDRHLLIKINNKLIIFFNLKYKLKHFYYIVI